MTAMDRRKFLLGVVAAAIAPQLPKAEAASVFYAEDITFTSVTGPISAMVTIRKIGADCWEVVGSVSDDV